VFKAINQNSLFDVMHIQEFGCQIKALLCSPYHYGVAADLGQQVLAPW
jgi:hypothetical protein